MFFDIGIPILAHGFITMGQYVVYIHDICKTLNLYLGSRVSLASFAQSFYLVILRNFYRRVKMISDQGTNSSIFKYIDTICEECFLLLCASPGNMKNDNSDKA